MTSTADENPSTPSGALWALFAVTCFSANDVIFKFLSGDFPLYQIIFFRSVIGLTVLLAIVAPLAGGWRVLRTRRLGAHLLRGAFIVFANFCFFLGLAAMPLAEAVAIFFVSPLVIAVLSVVFLGETVGPRRWLAIAVGLAGVLIVLRPGTAAFQPASLLPVLAAFGYAALHMQTRRIRATENATAMSFYVQSMFFVISGGASLVTGDGSLAVSGHPSVEFLLRGWVWPPAGDLALMVAIGVLSVGGSWSIGQAYRVSEAALVAPFEYAALPLAVLWGVTVFGEWPDMVAVAGIAVILASGVVLVWLEARAKRRRTPWSRR